jgi:hypothetical protein
MGSIVKAVPIEAAESGSLGAQKALEVLQENFRFVVVCDRRGRGRGQD